MNDGIIMYGLDKVVNTTIAADLEDINKKVKEASFNLRSERCRLIQVRACVRHSWQRRLGKYTRRHLVFLRFFGLVSALKLPKFHLKREDE